MFINSAEDLERLRSDLQSMMVNVDMRLKNITSTLANEDQAVSTPWIWSKTSKYISVLNDA